MTNNKNSSRWYSNKQEKSIAQAVGGKLQPNSRCYFVFKTEMLQMMIGYLKQKLV